MKFDIERVKNIVKLLDEFKKEDPKNMNSKSFNEKFLSKIAQKGDPFYEHDMVVVGRIIADTGSYTASDGENIFSKISSSSFNIEMLKIFDKIYPYDASRKVEIRTEKLEFLDFIKKIKEEIL